MAEEPKTKRRHGFDATPAERAANMSKTLQRVRDEQKAAAESMLAIANMGGAGGESSGSGSAAGVQAYVAAMQAQTFAQAQLQAAPMAAGLSPDEVVQRKQLAELGYSPETYKAALEQAQAAAAAAPQGPVTVPPIHWLVIADP